VIAFEAAFAGMRRQGGDIFIFGGKTALFDSGAPDNPFGRTTDEPADLFIFYDPGWQIGTEGSDE